MWHIYGGEVNCVNRRYFYDKKNRKWDLIDVNSMSGKRQR